MANLALNVIECMLVCLTSMGQLADQDCHGILLVETEAQMECRQF